MSARRTSLRSAPSGLLPSLARGCAAAVVTLATVAAPAGLAAQEPGADPALEQVAAQFESTARRTVALARAMPAETYGWAPAEDVQTVAEAYMHIARYNYMYLEENLGIRPPEGLDYANWEETVGDRDDVLPLLEASMDHVRAGIRAMADAGDAGAETTLYGRTVPRWAVILQLVTHMNQHLGQEIAYARSNGVAPPWSR